MTIAFRDRGSSSDSADLVSTGSVQMNPNDGGIHEMQIPSDLAPTLASARRHDPCARTSQYRFAGERQ
jgi:hypothetical protein